MQPAGKGGSSTRVRLARRALRLMALAVILFALLQTFIGEASVVPTPSMEGTILVGDHLLLNKALYGPPIPFTKVRLPRLKTVRRGDIVAFHSPRDARLCFIKRVVGVGGDRVEIRNDVVHVNSVPVFEPYVLHRRGLRREFMPARTVPEGHLFVLGDNRDNSEDSRVWGTVPTSNVIGEPLMVFWSYEAPTSVWLDKEGNLRLAAYASAIGHLFANTRWSRTGTLL